MNHSASISSTAQHLIPKIRRRPSDLDYVNANFKANEALRPLVDPLVALRGLSMGVLVKYVHERAAIAESSGTLEMGPAMVRQPWEPIVSTAATKDDNHQLKARAPRRDKISWLRGPLLDVEIVRPSWGTRDDD